MRPFSQVLKVGHSVTVQFDPPCGLYRDVVQFLADESGETSPDDIVPFSQGYPGVVHDVKSYASGRMAAMPRMQLDAVGTVDPNVVMCIFL